MRTTNLVENGRDKRVDRRLLLTVGILISIYSKLRHPIYLLY